MSQRNHNNVYTTQTCTLVNETYKETKNNAKRQDNKGTDWWTDYSYILWRMIYNIKAAVETESKTLT